MNRIESLSFSFASDIKYDIGDIIDVSIGKNEPIKAEVTGISKYHERWWVEVTIGA